MLHIFLHIDDKNYFRKCTQAIIWQLFQISMFIARFCRVAVITSKPQLTMFSLFLSFRDFPRPFGTVLIGNLQYSDWKTHAISKSPPVIYQLSGCPPLTVFGPHGWVSRGTLTFSVCLFFWLSGSLLLKFHSCIFQSFRLSGSLVATMTI